MLDVPAISYSDVEQQQRERAEAAKAAPTSKSTASKRGKAAPRQARSARTQTATVRRGEVGPAVVAAVEVKLADGLNASQAFEAVAKERGMKAGAVSANYYRVKRSQSKATKTSGAQKRPAARKANRPRAVASVASGGVSDIDQVLADLVNVVQALVDAVKQQRSEVAELRSRLGQVGSALGA